MKTAQLAARVQMAALPEGEYGYSQAVLGALDLAYPEVQVGLRLKASPHPEPVLEGGWTVIECRSDAADLRRGLQAVAEAYQARSEMPPAQTPPTHPPEEQGGAEVPTATPVETAPADETGARSSAIALPESLVVPASMSTEVEVLLVHYLGTHLLRAIQRAPTDVAAWWPTGSQATELRDAVAFAGTVVHGQPPRPAGAEGVP